VEHWTWWVLAGLAIVGLGFVLYRFAPVAFGAARSWNAYRRGLARYNAGDLEGAERCWQEAVRLSWLNVSARLGLGKLLAARGRAEQALRQYREALEVKPGYGKAHMNMANLLLELGRHDQAVQSYELAAAAGIHRAHKMMGMIYQQHHRDRRRALENYARYLNVVGRDPEVEAWIRKLTGKDR